MAGQRKADRKRNQEGTQTTEAAAPPARCKPCKGGGCLRQPPFRSGACPASQGTSEAGPGGPAAPVSALFGEALPLFPRLLLLSCRRGVYMQIWVAPAPPPPPNSLQGRGEGAAPLREAGEGPCPRQSWFLRLPSRACLPRTVLFVTKDTHSWAFREITTVSLSWGQQRDVCKETLLSEKLNHPARQTEGRASARLLSQAPPKSRAPTAGHGERPSSDTPRGSRRTRHTTHLLTTPALIRLKPPQRALSWGTRGKGGKGPGGHRAGSEGWDARKGCSTRPLLMPLNFWEERSPQIT